MKGVDDSFGVSWVQEWVAPIAYRSTSAVFFSLDKIDGFKREFSIDDPRCALEYSAIKIGI